VQYFIVIGRRHSELGRLHSPPLSSDKMRLPD